jgi:hypothetical protein
VFDRVDYLVAEPLLVSIGSRYGDFWPVTDAEIVTLLAARRREHAAAAATAPMALP